MTKTIGVIFGGRSEHEGSIEHALDVMSCLQQNSRYQVLPIYITKQGAWLYLKSQARLPIDSVVSDVAIVAGVHQKG